MTSESYAPAAFFNRLDQIAIGAETVIDNYHPSVTRIGPWSNGAGYEYAAPGPGSSRFQFPARASPGHYAVFAQWGGSLPTATQVPYIIHHGGGTTTVRVNQQINKRPGVLWNALGAFHLDPAAGDMVELSNDAVPAGSLWYRQKIIADGVRYVRLPDPVPGAVIVDDSDAGAVRTGAWNLDAWADGGVFWGTNVYNNQPGGTGTDTVTWTPALTSAGRYHVYARWTAHANRATDAKYTVNHAGGATLVQVNQEIDGGRWNLLGSFNMAPGAGNNVDNRTSVEVHGSKRVGGHSFRTILE